MAKALKSTAAGRKVEDTTASMAAAQPSGGKKTWQRLDESKVVVAFNWRRAEGEPREAFSCTLDFGGVDTKTLQYWSATNGVIVKLQALLRNNDARVVNGGVVPLIDIMPAEGQRGRGAAGNFARKDHVAEERNNIARMIEMGVSIPPALQRKMLGEAEKRQAEFEAQRAKREAAKAASQPTVEPQPLAIKAAKAKR